jgi:hypothetical protein
MALDFGLDPNDPRNRDRFGGFAPSNQFASAEPPPPRPPANIPPSVLQEQSGANIRKGQLQPQLFDQLDYAAKNNGVLAHVYSGGQPAKGQGWPRTGSTRHDLGGAADLTLTDVKDGHTLDMTNPQDQARMAGFVRDAVRAGATGVGAHPDYMGPHGMHIGGGVEAAWGARNSSANAPPWLTAAWQDGMKNRMSPGEVKTALAATNVSSPEGSASAFAPSDTKVPTTKTSTTGPSTGEIAAAAINAGDPKQAVTLPRTPSPNYPGELGLPPQFPVANAQPGTPASVPIPMRRPATAPTAVPQAAPGPNPVATATQPAATGAARSAAPPPAPPGARTVGASPTAVPKAAPGPTPVATGAQPAATGAVRAAAGGPTLGEAIIKAMGPRGTGMSTYVDPNTQHQIINPGGSGEQAMGITRDIGPLSRQTPARPAPAAPQRPSQPPGAGTTASPAVQPVSPPKPDFAGPNAPFPFAGSVPNAPGQPPPGSFASRFPGADRFNMMPTPVAPEAAGVLAAPTVNPPPPPPRPQPYPSVTEQLPPGFNVFAGNTQPPPTSISQLPWWPFADGGGVSWGNSYASSGDWGSGY